MVKKILIVDEDLSFTDRMGLKLTERGYLVSCAHYGKQGLASAEKFRPNIIFIDLKLPDIAGYEILITLRRSEDMMTRKTPMIAMASGMTDNMMYQAYVDGADYVMEKPFRDRTLFAIVDYLIGNITEAEREKLELLI